MEMNLPDGAGGHTPYYPDTDYEGLVDAQIAKAEAHNNLFRGKEITESWASLKARIAQGDFSDLYIGDKKEITLTTGEKVVMEIAGIDRDYQFCDTAVGHHIDFISRDALATTYQFNATNTNNGTSSQKCPWLASALYTTLNSTVYNTLPSDLKSNIITKRALLEERYSAGGAVAADTSWSWQNMGNLWIPTEIEVFGHHTWSEPGYGTGCAGGNIQYPIFRLAPSHIIKGAGNGGSRCSWWEASAHRTGAAGFCAVGSDGGASGGSASVTGIRAPLCFRIG